MSNVIAKAKLRHRIFILMLILIILFITDYIVSIMHNHILLNHTNSLDGIVYKLTELKQPVKRNQIVMICLDSQLAKISRLLTHDLGSSRCPFNSEPLIKIVAAVPGDEIETAESGILINGQLFSGSRPRQIGLPQFKFKGIVPKDRYLLLTHNPLSFDGRYFGFTQGNDLLKQAKKIF